MTRHCPSPNDPPGGYAIDRDQAVFFRRVGAPEYAQWLASGRLDPEPGGMALGKHLTTSPDLARAWGALFVSSGWEQTAGHVLEVRLAKAVAQRVHYVGPKTDGIGPCYFATFEQLADAQITEVMP
jgi:hypothetical protein